MQKVPVVKMGVLEAFERYFTQHEELIKRDLRSSGEEYPGKE